MDELPKSLNYSASKNIIKYKRFNVKSSSTNSGSANSIFRFKLPNGLINLSSFTLCFDLLITGLDDGSALLVILQGELADLQAELALLTPNTQAYTDKENEIDDKQDEITNVRQNYSNVKFPHGHKLIRELRTYVNNQQINNKCSDYDIIYNALMKASVNENYIYSKLEEHSIELITNYDDYGVINPTVTTNGYTSKQASYVVSDFLGIFNGEKSIIDTSLWGDVELEFIINDNYCLSQYVAGSGSNLNIKFELKNVEGFVEKVTEISSVYNKLVNMMLENRIEPLYYCYQNIITTINSTGKSSLLQVKSQCIDAVVVFPLSLDYQNKLAVFDPDLSTSSPRYQFNSGKLINLLNVNSTKNCNLQITVNGENYPDNPINNALHVANITSSALSRNNLFYSFINTRQQFLDDNFIWYQSLCNVEGYVSKILTGYDTNGNTIPIIVNHDCIVSGGSLFIAVLTTSSLVLNPTTKQMFVIE